MAITGVRVTRPDGVVKIYEIGRSFDFDGYGDLVVRDADGAAVAVRKRASVDEAELIVVGPAVSHE